MVTVNRIGDRDPMDEPKELCMLIDAVHKAGRKIQVHTRYTREQLEGGAIPGVMWVRTALDKADKVVTA